MHHTCKLSIDVCKKLTTCMCVIVFYLQAHENNTAALNLFVSKFNKCQSCHEHKHKSLETLLNTTFTLSMYSMHSVRKSSIKYMIISYYCIAGKFWELQFWGFWGFCLTLRILSLKLCQKSRTDLLPQFTD